VVPYRGPRESRVATGPSQHRSKAASPCPCTGCTGRVWRGSAAAHGPRPVGLRWQLAGRSDDPSRWAMPVRRPTRQPGLRLARQPGQHVGKGQWCSANSTIALNPREAPARAASGIACGAGRRGCDYQGKPQWVEAISCLGHCGTPQTWSVENRAAVLWPYVSRGRLTSFAAQPAALASGGWVKTRWVSPSLMGTEAQGLDTCSH